MSLPFVRPPVRCLALSRRAAVGGLVAGLAAGLAGCESESPPLRFGSNVWPGYEPLFVARQQGFLPPSIRLVELVSASQVMRGMRNQVLDAAGLTLDEAIRLAAETSDVEILAVMDVSAGGDGIVGQAGLKRVQDLVGRRVGVEKSAVGSYVLTRALERVGLTPASVTAVYLPAQEHHAAFLEKTVDAVVTFEPTLGKLVRMGGEPLFSSREIPDEIVDVLVARRSLLQARSADFRYLTDTWFSARQLVQDSLASTPLATLRLGDDVDAVRAAYRGITMPDRARSRELLGSSEGSLRTTAERIQTFLLRTSLLDQPIDCAALFPEAPR